MAGLAPANFILAAGHLDIVINEICWMGTEEGWQYEWLELYNDTDKEINLTGWKIENGKAKQKTLEISEGKIAANDYFLICKKKIERCNLEISTLSLNNNYQENGKIILKDKQGNLVDQTPEADNSNWPAGDNKNKQTMEKAGLNNWQTSQNSGGTPKAQNSIILPSQNKLEEGGPPPIKAEIIETQAIVYPTGVVINEILPSPEGPDAENEWIELFNQNGFEVALAGWKITDTKGSVKTYIFPEKTIIKPQGFLILGRLTAKITLNNNGDGLKLVQPDGTVADEVIYKKAPQGQSYNRITLESVGTVGSPTSDSFSSWQWSSILTPNSVNTIPELKKIIENSSLLTENFTKEKQSDSASTATQNSMEKEIQENKQKVKSLFVLLSAFCLASFSGGIILFLKKKLKTPVLIK